MANNPLTTNPWNQMLQSRREALSRAFRYALTPGCNPTTGAPKLDERQQRAQLLHIPIVANVNGDNLIIPTLAGKKLIYEIFLWNSDANPVNFALYNGPSATGILLVPVDNFPATTGFTLGFNGSWEQPHFEIDNGQPFVLTNSTGGLLQGFARYKIQNGT